MSLDNLVGISFDKITPDPVTIQKLLNAAKRNIADAHIEQVSLENRFDAAYKAIMQLANASLQANGYRTLTSKPGHHMTMIQSLEKTVFLDKEQIILLDALRKQRNIVDYSGDPVPKSVVIDCILSAESLLSVVNNYFQKSI